MQKPATAFWGNILRALGTEPRFVSSIKGSSGIEHPVFVAGVDDTRKRLLVVSRERESRHAAMLFADVQAAMTPYKVVIVRPIAVNVGHIARQLVIDKVDLTAQPARPFGRIFSHIQSEVISQSFRAANYIETMVFDSLGETFSQMDISELLEKAESTKHEPGVPTDLDFGMEKWLKVDPLHQDREAGVCSFPLYDFSNGELESVVSSRDSAEIRDLLGRHEVLQYFFPAPDQLALGLIDRRASNRSVDVIAGVRTAPDLGHPFGSMELIDDKTPLTSMIDALKERKLIVEGEIGYEVAEAGKVTRSRISFKPREGIVSKLLNQIELKINIKKLFGVDTSDKST